MHRSWCVDQVPLPSVLINNYLDQQQQQQQPHSQAHYHGQSSSLQSKRPRVTQQSAQQHPVQQQHPVHTSHGGILFNNQLIQSSSHAASNARNNEFSQSQSAIRHSAATQHPHQRNTNYDLNTTSALGKSHKTCLFVNYPLLNKN